MANHRYLIQLKPFNFLLAWGATCDKHHLWAMWPVSGNVPDLNLLDLNYDFPSYNSDSPDLVWLFSRLQRACQKGHIDAIKAIEMANTAGLQEAMIQYLAVAAAAKGQLQVVEYLWDKLNAPVKAFFIMSDRTKVQAFTAIEHAAISGNSQIVLYLADHGSVSPSILITLGVFREFLDEAIFDNNIPIIESLLTFFNVNTKVGGLETHCRKIEQHLSNALVNAVAHDRREVVRTLLKNGVDPNMPDDVGCTPLIAAIRFSRDSVVSILLEYDCLLGNTIAGMPLTVAACLGDLRIVRKLILHDAEVFREPTESGSLMSMACLGERFTGALENVSPPNLHISPTPLYMACYHGHLNVVELLLSYGAATNFLSPSAIICIEKRDQGSQPWAMKYFLQRCLSSLDDILSGSFFIQNAVALGGTSWELPMAAAMSRGHTTIVDALISSGALWPEEFACIYGSCLGSLDDELESFATQNFYTVNTRSPLNKREINAVTHHLRRDPGFIRTFMIEMGMPRITTGRIHAVAELHLFNSVVTALQLEFLKFEQQLLGRRIVALQDDVLNANPGHRDPLQVSMIKIARQYRSDFSTEYKMFIQALLDAGASITIRDKVNMPHRDLVEAALRGNPKVRHALVGVGVAAAVSSVNGPKESFGRENLARLIQKSIAPSIHARYGRPASKVYAICEILEAAVRSNDEQSLRRLYQSLVFPSSDLGPAAAMFAAVDHGTQEVMELVYKYRADFGSNIHVRDYNGATPLLYAIERKASVSVIRCLLSHGADPSAVDNDGETVLYKAAATCNDEDLDCLFGLTYDADEDYLDAWDVIIALDICLSQRNSEAWNCLAKACRDRLPTPVENRESTRPKKTRTTLDSLKQTLSMSHDGHELLLECWTTYEKARGRHLVQEHCQQVDGLFELSAVTFQDKIESPPSPAPLIHAEEPKRTKRLSEAAAALLERQAREDLLLKYGLGT
ncbi:ankyrin [Hyaloscypha variabilis F]|uniref:Ankyrin n=1 Tax=Hyaloscypha variabilis (strain UAMH 11265 / GT02V1 / F) TaxID=1149755 RepID=A0A2J6RR05_HYAVF|nr:ankyrin [Hyaloscypha variabilis F]